MKTLSIIILFSGLSFAQISKDKAVLLKESLPDTVITTNIDTVKIKMVVKDKKNEIVEYNQTVTNKLSFRMIYNKEYLESIIFSDGYTATLYNIYIGKSLNDCLGFADKLKIK